MAHKVLLIESEPETSQEIEAALAAQGFAVTAVDDGGVALKKLVSEPFAAIVLAVELPRGSGYSICNKVKKDPKLGALPLIITSSKATEQTFAQHRKLKTRADAYLKKPFPMQQLVAELQRLLAGGPAKDELLDISHDEAAAFPDQGIEVKLEEEPPAPAARAAPEMAATTVMKVPAEVLAEMRPKPAASAASKPAAGPAAAPASGGTGVKNPLQTENERLRKELQALRAKAQELENAQQERELQANERLMAESGKGRELIEVKKKLAALERDQGGKDKQIETLSTKLTQLAEKAKALLAEREKTAGELAQATQGLADASAERDKLSAAVGQLQHQLQQAKGEISNLHQSSGTQAKSLQAELEALKRQSGSTIDALKKDHATLQERLAEAQAQLAGLRQEVAGLEARVNAEGERAAKAQKAISIAQQLLRDYGFAQ